MPNLTIHPTDFEDSDTSCPECGDEGFIFDCFDGFCAGAEEGCDDCTRPCPTCSPRYALSVPKSNRISRRRNLP